MKYLLNALKKLAQDPGEFDEVFQQDILTAFIQGEVNNLKQLLDNIVSATGSGQYDPQWVREAVKSARFSIDIITSALLEQPVQQTTQPQFEAPTSSGTEYDFPAF